MQVRNPHWICNRQRISGAMAAAAEFEEDVGPMSIYKASRIIKRRENCLLYNALRSIYEDSVFVAEIAQLWPDLPLLANLRCGLWYSSRAQGTCYFKSTDGHNNNWSFSTARLNLHVASLAGQRGGCLIVDSTRKGKRFPDSMSKTIPIWACVLNHAIANRLRRQNQRDGTMDSRDWDTSLHLPLWVSSAERGAIEDRLEEWTRQLENCGADIDSLLPVLRKPLRPLWVSQMSIVWLNEVPESESWPFTPIILVSASSPNGFPQQRSTCEFSWHYIPGAGDDEESWARGLTPGLFWKHSLELIRSGPHVCNQKVAELLEKDRVYRSQRGINAPQISVKSKKSVADQETCVDFDSSGSTIHERDQCSVSWVDSSGLAVGRSSTVDFLGDSVDCVLDCDAGSRSSRVCESSGVADYLHLPIVTSKLGRFSLQKSLPCALKFAQTNLSRGKKVLISCSDGEDISVCVCLAVFSRLFDQSGLFDDGKSFSVSCCTKWELRKRLVIICKFVPSARPSRGNLRQVFSFLSQERENNGLVPILPKSLHPRAYGDGERITYGKDPKSTE